MIEFETIKLYISLGSLLNITQNRNFAFDVQFMQYVQFRVQHQMEHFQKCSVFVMERLDVILLWLHLKLYGNIIHIEIRISVWCKWNYITIEVNTLYCGSSSIKYIYRIKLLITQ